MALAAFLEQQGEDYVILEQAEAFDRVGYGIALWRNGIAMLEELGVAENVFGEGYLIDRFEIRDSAGDPVTSVDLAPHERMLLAVHRADIHDALRSVVPREKIVMDAAPTGVEMKGDGVKVTAAGKEFAGELLVGADGVHSWVRESVFQQGCEETDTHLWWFWLPEGMTMPDKLALIWVQGSVVIIGKNRHQGLVELGATVRDGQDPEDVLEAAMSEVGGVVEDAYTRVDPDQVFHDTAKRVRLPSWTKDRTVLIGDAAHAVHPITGMGASMALTDAYALAEEIGDGGSVQNIFGRYEARRRPDLKKTRREELFLYRTMYTSSPVFHRVMKSIYPFLPLARYYKRRLRAHL